MEVVYRRLVAEVRSTPPIGDYKLARAIHRAAKQFLSAVERECCEGEPLVESHHLTGIIRDSAKKLVQDLEMRYSIRKN